jgi:hypothetical protein
MVSVRNIISVRHNHKFKMFSFVEGKCVRHDQELNQLFKFALHFDIIIQK